MKDVEVDNMRPPDALMLAVFGTLGRNNGG